MKIARPPLSKARIEIIPMIDTIFFLLVFFIYTSLQRVSMSAPPVNLPDSVSADGRTTKKVVLTVDRSGRYFVDKVPHALPEILPVLRERIARDRDLAVVINADRGQRVGEIQKLIEIGKQADPAQMFIATAHEAGRASAGGRP